MKNIISKTTKRYLMSSLITFIGGFALVVTPMLDESLTIEAVKSGALGGIVFAGVRAGIKAIFELFIANFNSKK